MQITITVSPDELFEIYKKIYPDPRAAFLENLAEARKITHAQPEA